VRNWGLLGLVVLLSLSLCSLVEAENVKGDRSKKDIWEFVRKIDEELLQVGKGAVKVGKKSKRKKKVVKREIPRSKKSGKQSLPSERIWKELALLDKEISGVRKSVAKQGEEKEFFEKQKQETKTVKKESPQKKEQKKAEENVVQKKEVKVQKQEQRQKLKREQPKRKKTKQKIVRKVKRKKRLKPVVMARKEMPKVKKERPERKEVVKSTAVPVNFGQGNYPPDVKVSMIVISPKDKLCILNGNIYREGDWVEGCVISRIKTTGVELTCKTGRYFFGVER